MSVFFSMFDKIKFKNPKVEKQKFKNKKKNVLDTLTGIIIIIIFFIKVS